CAFLPRDGQSLLMLTQLPEGADDQIQASMVVEPPVAWLTPEGAAVACYGRCSTEQVEWAIARRQPQPVTPMGEPVALDGGTDEPDRSYIVCTEDRALPPALQRRMAPESPCVEVTEIVADHSPFFSATVELADVLDRYARA